MTRQEAIKILKAKLACMEREMRGTDEDCNKHNCLNCDLNYKQGTMGEQMEVLQIAIDALDKDTNVVSKSDDPTSRQAAIDAVHKDYDTILDFKSDGRTVAGSFEDIINALPPAQPEPCEDAVPRTSVEYICQKNTVSTNPYEHKYHDKFIQFMNDPVISDFGRWRWANGFNTALTAVEIDLKKLPSAQPDVPDINVGDISKKPEIICKDCKHSEKWYRDKSRCFLWNEDGIDVFDTGFCNYAERRTDE